METVIQRIFNDQAGGDRGRVTGVSFAVYRYKRYDDLKVGERP